MSVTPKKLGTFKRIVVIKIGQLLYNGFEKGTVIYYSSPAAVFSRNGFQPNFINLCLIFVRNETNFHSKRNYFV
jgi:hypothetical protein